MSKNLYQEGPSSTDWLADTWTWTKAELRRSAEVSPLLERVLARMAEHSYPRRFCQELRLALEEAVVNGLRHGNAGDPTKRVLVRYRVLPEAVLIDVEDEGPGFDPTAVPDPTRPENLDRPSGRGLLLMRHCTNWLWYRGRGNRVMLCKYRPPAEPPSPTTSASPATANLLK
jgi:serine/threonine-protein kinase RsbW